MLNTPQNKEAQKSGFTMGQVESTDAVAETQTTTNDSSNPTSLEYVLLEAAEYGNQHAQSVEAMAHKALECPCIADLRTGPCGSQFSEAFLCFLKSTSEEKSCIKANPDAFSKDILGENESNESEPIQEYKILPPKWAKESKSPKSKL